MINQSLKYHHQIHTIDLDDENIISKNVLYEADQIKHIRVSLPDKRHAGNIKVRLPSSLLDWTHLEGPEMGIFKSSLAGTIVAYVCLPSS